MTQIAKEAGVSVTTVSLLLRGDKNLRISEEKRQKIMAVKERLGGVRHGVLARQTSRNIAVPIHRNFSAEWWIHNFVSSPFLKHFERSLQENEFRSSVVFFEDDTRERLFDELTADSSQCAGLLLLTGVVNEELARMILGRQTPHISFDRSAEAFGINTVTADAHGGLRQAINHLQSLGHRQIGFCGPASIPSPRFPLFVAVKAEQRLPMDAGMDCPVEAALSPGLNNREEWRASVRQFFTQWWKQKPLTTGLVCHNDAFALEVLAIMRDLGLTPGKELSVVGYDNVEERGNPPVVDPVLTTIDNPTDRIGRQCGSQLLEQVLKRQTETVHIRIPTRLIIRKSTGPCLQ